MNTEALRAYFHKLKAPHSGFVMDLATGPALDFPVFIIYRDNLEEYSESQKQDLLMWVTSVLTELRDKHDTLMRFEIRPYAADPQRVEP